MKLIFVFSLLSNLMASFVVATEKPLISSFDRDLVYPTDHSRHSLSLERLALAGNAAAQFHFSVILGKGLGVKRNALASKNWMLRAADGGYPRAQAVLGWTKLRSGEYKEAMDWLLKAAIQKDAEAYYTLGHMHENGLGVAQKYDEAAQWYQKAADQSHCLAQISLALMFEQGRGVDQDYFKAHEIYFKAASNGNARAQLKVGEMYRLGVGVEKNNSEAFKWFGYSAMQNNTNALYKLAKMHKNGLGTHINLAKSLELATKAASLGHVKACRLAGELHFGEGNFSESFRYNHLAADAGDKKAQFIVCLAYKEGKIVDQNAEKALAYCQKAHQQGVKEASFELGTMFHDGLGVQKDYKEAFKYWRISLGNGIYQAANKMGLAFQYGFGVSQNFSAAAFYFNEAAKAEIADAQYNLALLLEQGFGTHYSTEGPQRLLEKAANAGHHGALLKLRNLDGHGETQFLMAKLNGKTPEARYLYERSAAMGNMKAQYELGRLYEQGACGLPQNFDLALWFYALAQGQGSEEAKIAYEALLRKTASKRKGSEKLFSAAKRKKG